MLWSGAIHKEMSTLMLCSCQHIVVRRSNQSAAITETMGEHTSSSLLQLPRKLRDRIWSYAYGDLIVHAEPACVDQKMNPSGNYAFRYVLCQQLGSSSDSLKMLECCPGAKRGSANGERTPFFWPIVNKQFWAETIEIFYASATFKVAGSVDLYILASSQQQSVRRMRKLEVRIGLGIRHHNRIWSPARCSSVIKHFENLRGLTLLIGLVVEDDSNYTGTCVNYNYDNGKRIGTVIRGSRMEGWVWEEQRNWFPVFLRSFQQHHLQDNLTRVAVIDRRKQNRGRAFNYHEKDPRSREKDLWREDVVIQEALRQDLAVSMRAVLLGQNISQLFPDWEVENERLLEENERT
ncbi:hypothetical protein BU25DRAFT_447880 [Macroventuria anomochaeta]|uniref:Uncharacterized protein n=1 Tax=Macroventuria anomochaeta TaxID=301207 RepID=A0ACB6S289_9PLEO|nr:uncharacterized protein BU25DRAFT_447880 [Macroventuria anomochaeta]KAF2628386.1 hypothetical protein BU25DRAFT_447880 [Macroventuria anomochaeta]